MEGVQKYNTVPYGILSWIIILSFSAQKMKETEVCHLMTAVRRNGAAKAGNPVPCPISLPFLADTRQKPPRRVSRAHTDTPHASERETQHPSSPSPPSHHRGQPPRAPSCSAPAAICAALRPQPGQSRRAPAAAPRSVDGPPTVLFSPRCAAAGQEVS